MKKRLSILTCKGSSFLLKLVKRGGSLPGTLASKVDSKILEKIQTNAKIILVTGTNGKTSTANMIASMFEANGSKIISNRKGDNMKAGITTSIVTQANMNGFVDCDYIVLEVDELNIPHVVNDLNVDSIVVTNFFRDQLDRAKEMELLISKVENSLVNFKGTLILNGNDPNVCRLKNKAKYADVLYYTMNECDESVKESNEASEGKFCPKCHSLLKYDFYQYSHIGKFTCSNESCDFKTHEDVSGEVVNITNHEFKYQDQVFKAPQAGFYTMYNCMAVMAVASKYHISLDCVRASFENFVIPSGRNESFKLNGQDCIMNLIKNPTGANEVMKVMEADEREKDILIVLNDAIQDGTDISWIYDTAFEKILNSSTKSIICSGARCYEMALRLKYSGYEEHVVVIENLEEACSEFAKKTNVKYAVATYTALMPTRKLLVKQS